MTDHDPRLGYDAETAARVRKVFDRHLGCRRDDCPNAAEVTRLRTALERIGAIAGEATPDDVGSLLRAAVHAEDIAYRTLQADSPMTVTTGEDTT